MKRSRKISGVSLSFLFESSEILILGASYGENPDKEVIGMTFAETLRNYRKQAGMSQEKLAETIGVSRQAITKWETGGGIPDIENMMALSELFHVSLDELLAGEKEKKDFLYESMTEYDIDFVKHYDIQLGGANTIVMSAYEGEKLRVRLASNAIPSLQSDFKIKIDDIKNRIDVDLSRFHDRTEAEAKEGLFAFVLLPQQYVTKIELTANTGRLELQNIQCENLEFNGRVSEVYIEDVTGTVEVDSNLDMEIICKTMKGSVEINQISATSRITIPADTAFQAVKKGIANQITFEKNGMPAEDFSDQEAENHIELNGIKSELVICSQAGV